MSSQTPRIWWIRRDLRLADNPALTAAAKDGAPVIPVYILDQQEDDLGAAPKFRLGLGLGHLAKTLEKAGSRLILRRGPALEVLRKLVQETGARAIHWERLYDPRALDRDRKVKSALKEEDGLEAASHGGRLMFEPWTVETKTGGMYKVYTPFWKAVRGREVADLLPEPRLNAPEQWPASDDLQDWNMGAAMRRGADVVAAHCCVGEQAARDRLQEFRDERLSDYKENRDLPGTNGTSNLSENLAWGEISPHRMWHAGQDAMQHGSKGAETFLKEIVWREFAYHLMFNSPHIVNESWREEWQHFPWRENPDETTTAWQRGQTGYDFVDAAMRELYTTGRMHNRARMIVASFLTKHLMTHWKIGLNWFEHCLVDWDPASNAMGWQWVAGSGPDASPFFRVFNPDGQLDKFDPKRAYVRAWIAEGQQDPPDTARAFFDAIPRSWGLSADMARAEPVVGLKEGRERALEAYHGNRNAD